MADPLGSPVTKTHRAWRSSFKEGCEGARRQDLDLCRRTPRAPVDLPRGRHTASRPKVVAWGGFSIFFLQAAFGIVVGIA